MNNKRFLLAAINSKYIHSNLAVRYLKKYSEKSINDIGFMEFSINDSIHNILKELYLYRADVICFSCYIWNIELVLKLCGSIKKADPDIVIILGGPEVSYDSTAIMAANEAVDYIIFGEGEQTFLELALQLEKAAAEPGNIAGIAYRNDGSIMQNTGRALLHNLDELPFPYDEFSSLQNRIIYYETSRGCPYNCQYCLSSTIEGVRYFSLERVKAEIEFFVKSGVKQVKLVDRTFNCSKGRSLEIIRHIISLGSSTNFHFEIAADILDDELLAAISEAPEGMFQFEIGVQTTNSQTLQAIKRPMAIDKVKSNVNALSSFKNAHLHLDLIAGLPFEDYESFKKSFNDIHALKPDMLQLGFLKLLKGSGLRDAAAAYGIKYHSFPPYEVVSTGWLSYAEILKLKDVEHLVELYYNSGRFKNTLKFILRELYDDPYNFYEAYSGYWNCNKYYDSPKSVLDLFYILKEFISREHSSMPEADALRFNELMKLDWLLAGKGGPLPANIARRDHTGIKEKAQELIKDTEFIRGLVPDMEPAAVKAAQKAAYYELFATDVLNNASLLKDSLVLFVPVTVKGTKEIVTHAIDPDKL